jgi:hypothetical protein
LDKSLLPGSNDITRFISLILLLLSWLHFHALWMSQKIPTSSSTKERVYFLIQRPRIESLCPYYIDLTHAPDINPNIVTRKWNEQINLIFVT